MSNWSKFKNKTICLLQDRHSCWDRIGSSRPRSQTTGWVSLKEMSIAFKLQWAPLWGRVGWCTRCVSHPGWVTLLDAGLPQKRNSLEDYPGSEEQSIEKLDFPAGVCSASSMNPRKKADYGKAKDLKDPFLAVRAEQGKAWEEACMTPTKESSKHLQLGGCHVSKHLLMLLTSPSTHCSIAENPD